MKDTLIALATELVISLIVALVLNNGMLNYDFMTGFGLVNLILSVIGIIVGVIFISLKERERGQSIVAASGILFLIGAGTCTAFPISLNMK